MPVKRPTHSSPDYCVLFDRSQQLPQETKSFCFGASCYVDRAQPTGLPRLLTTTTFRNAALRHTMFFLDSAPQTYRPGTANKEVPHRRAWPVLLAQVRALRLAGQDRRSFRPYRWMHQPDGEAETMLFDSISQHCSQCASAYGAHVPSNAALAKQGGAQLKSFTFLRHVREQTGERWDAAMAIARITYTRRHCASTQRIFASVSTACSQPAR